MTAAEAEAMEELEDLEDRIREDTDRHRDECRQRERDAARLEDHGDALRELYGMGREERN